MKLGGWGAGVLLATALGVATLGCSGSSKSASTSSDRAQSATGAAVSGSGASASGGQAPTQLATVDPVTRKQVRTGQIALGATSRGDVAEVADRAVAVATDAGGQVDDDKRTGGSSPTADLVLRVPPDALDATVEKVAALATVTNRSVQTDDVTSQYTDLEGRIAALQTSTERLRGFLAQAGDANQIASIEGELTRRESDLESLQGQLRVLTAKTDLATLAVSVRTQQSVADAKAPAPAKALSNGWDAFRLTMTWALAIVLATAPFLVLLGAVALVVRWWRRRIGSRPERPSSLPPPPTPPSPEPVGAGIT
jgi:hypothetical protein